MTVLTDAVRMEQHRHMDRTARVAAYRPRTSAVQITFCQLVDQTSTAVAANTRDSVVARITRRQRADQAMRAVVVNTRLMVVARTGLPLPAGPISRDVRVILISLDAVPMELLSPRALMAKVIARSTYNCKLI